MPALNTWYFQFFALMCGLILVALQRQIPILKMGSAILLGSLGSLGAFLPGKHEKAYIFAEHLATYPYMAFLFAGSFLIIANKERFYGRMTEGDVFLYTLSFFYLLTPWQTEHKILLALGAVPATFVLICTLFTLELTQLHKLIFSTWWFFLTAIFSGNQIFHGYLILRATPQLNLSAFESLEYFAGAILTAASALYLLGSILPLFDVLKGNSASSGVYSKSLYVEELPFLEERILSKQTPPKIILFISALHGLPLLLNLYFQIVPQNFALAYAMIISPMLTFALANFCFPEGEKATICS